MWPPNHKYARFEIGKEILVEARDQCSDDVSVRIVSVESDQPDQGARFGNRGDDVVFNDTTLCLRVERFLGDRTYTVTIEAVDGSGNPSRVSRTVRVPRAIEPGCSLPAISGVDDDSPECDL